MQGAGTLADGLAKSLDAFIAWRDGQYDAALSALNEITLPEYPKGEGDFFYGQHLNRYLRAEILYQEDRLEEALRWYASLAEVSEFLLGPSYLRRAEIYEQLGDMGNAITYYTRFLDLWQDADAELQPQVEQARQRLDRLVGDTVREPDDVANPEEEA